MSHSSLFSVPLIYYCLCLFLFHSFLLLPLNALCLSPFHSTLFLFLLGIPSWAENILSFNLGFFFPSLILRGNFNYFIAISVKLYPSCCCSLTLILCSSKLLFSSDIFYTREKVVYFFTSSDQRKLREVEYINSFFKFILILSDSNMFLLEKGKDHTIAWIKNMYTSDSFLI